MTARGNRRQEIFRDDRDRRRFLRLLGHVVATLRWRCHAYCLMPNHYHLVVETPNADLSIGMHRLNSLFAQWFNRRHDVDGHLFQGRFHSVLVESEWHLLELCRYVPLNPVRGGLCAHPGEWPWSSYRATVGRTAPPRFLSVMEVLDHFGPTVQRAREAFRVFVETAPVRAGPEAAG